MTDRGIPRGWGESVRKLSSRARCLAPGAFDIEMYEQIIEGHTASGYWVRTVFERIANLPAATAGSGEVGRRRAGRQRSLVETRWRLGPAHSD